MKDLIKKEQEDFEKYFAYVQSADGGKIKLRAYLDWILAHDKRILEAVGEELEKAFDIADSGLNIVEHPEEIDIGSGLAQGRATARLVIKSSLQVGEN